MIIEANAKLLDELEGYPDDAVREFISVEKLRLKQTVEEIRRQETELDRRRDERFE